MKFLLPGLVFGFAILLFPSHAQACSCANDVSFLQAAKRSNLVIRGKVVDYVWELGHYKQQEKHPLAMIVDVKERFKGSEKSRKIVVWGDFGMNCRPYVDRFPLGTEWVFAVQKNSDSLGEWEISVCGAYWLLMQGENVVGRISNPSASAKPESMKLAAFRKVLKSSR